MIKNQLLCHPANQCPLVDNLSVEVSQPAKQQLQICYILTGTMALLSIPKPQPSTPMDGLWQHTCFEAFLAEPGQTHYFEFNLSPSSQWAAYNFSDYRQQVPYTPTQLPQIQVSQSQDQLALTATIGLPPGLIGKPIQLGLTAVVEDQNGQLSYWAVKHPTAKPDFHHRDGFILPINPFNPLK